MEGKPECQKKKMFFSEEVLERGGRCRRAWSMAESGRRSRSWWGMGWTFGGRG